MQQLFTHEDAWSGGFYELAIELPETSKTTLREALTQLWAYPALEGCFSRPDIEPSNQSKVSSSDIDYEGHRYGIAIFPNRKMSCCGSFWGDYQDRGCWITLYLPLGSLSQVYPVR